MNENEARDLEGKLARRGWRQDASGDWHPPGRGRAVGGVAADGSERHEVPALERRVPEPARSEEGVGPGAGWSYSVHCVAYRRKLLDQDAVDYSMKPLTDAIAGTLGLDDRDQRIKWSYDQKATDGAEGVVVKVERTAATT